jgi:D-alanine transaminase
MTQIAYVNGTYVPLARAAVSIQDRGYQFGDAVYEVWGVRGGRLLDEAAHIVRLKRSLGELRIAMPTSDLSLMAIVRETQRRNRVRNGLIYLQISRGVATRDHAFPAAGTKPSLIVTGKSLDMDALEKRLTHGVKVVTLPETRWARCDIKSTNLLPNVLAKQAAREAGAYEAWFVDGDGLVVEGSSSSAWIVDSRQRLVTRDLSNRILHGITRAVVLKVAREKGMEVVEAPFSLADAQGAREAFMTAASAPLSPIVAIDSAPVSDGRPGPVAHALRAAYLGAAIAD